MTSSVSIRLFCAPFLIFALAGYGQKQDQTAAPTPPAQPPTPPPAQAEVAPAAPAKPRITKLDDLPRHTYPVQGTVLDLVTSADKFAPFAAQVRADTEKDLATYDIEDKTTLKGLKGKLLTLDLLEGRNDDARQLISELQALEDKPALRDTTGFITLARLDVMDRMKITDLADLSRPDFQQAFEQELAKRTAALPWDVVRDELKQTRVGFELVSRNLVLGEIKSELEPTVAKTGSLSGDLAGAVIHLRSSLLISIPVRQPIVTALNSVIETHNVAKADIWKDRQVTLTPDQKLTPVVMAIWDSGVDPAVYPNQLFVDPAAPKNAGPDADLHGIDFDLHSNRVHGDLYPLGADAKRFPQLKSQIKGMLDLEAGVESPEAADLRKKMQVLSQDQVKPFLEDLGLFGNYIHGTHVAGIATEGNPFARILIARLTFDYHLIPEKPTVEQARKDVLAYQATVDYFKQHNVRVVNMSWGGSLKGVEDALEKNGVGNADERKKEAREIFDIGKNGLYDALKSAPDILFITAAGNSDNDVNFDEVVPSSLDLPNLITVGAVDQAGDETSFTSFGKNVIAYADGFQVDSNIPGGSRLKLSGTSMASPEVANLAGKLFALDPKLTPADVISLIKEGLDPGSNLPSPTAPPPSQPTSTATGSTPPAKQILLLNPKKSVELLKARQDGKR